MNKQLLKALLSSLETTCTLLSQFIESVDGGSIDTKIEPIGFEKYIEKDIVVSFLNNRFGRDVTAKCRDADLVLIRNIYCYFLREHSQLSLADIGGILGGRDHTTIIHSLESIEKKMYQNEGYKQYIEKLCKELMDFNSNKLKSVA